MATTVTQATVPAGEYMTFRLGDAEFGINMSFVGEMRGYVEPTRVENPTPFLLGETNVRGMMTPIIDLRLRLGCDSPEYNEFTVVVVLNVRGRALGVVVDSVSNVLELRADQIKPATLFLSAEQIKPVKEFSELDTVKAIKYVGEIGERAILLMDIEAVLGGPEMRLLPPK